MDRDAGLNSPIAKAPSADGQADRQKRRLTARLLAGWVAFLLVSPFALHCESPIAKVNAGQESRMVERTVQDAPVDGHGEAPCPTPPGAQPTMLAYTGALLDPAPRFPAGPAQPGVFFVPRAAGPAKVPPSNRPLAPIPYHLRTARLLI